MISGKELFDWLNKIALDKMLHFVCGLLVAQVAFVCLGFALPKWACIVLSVVAVAVVGGLKELVDVKYGVPSWKDFVATMMGAIVELPIMMLWN